MQASQEACLGKMDLNFDIFIALWKHVLHVPKYILSFADPENTWVSTSVYGNSA